MPARILPARPDLSQYKKQAKEPTSFANWSPPARPTRRSARILSSWRH